jgi:hypothetical protein
MGLFCDLNPASSAESFPIQQFMDCCQMNSDWRAFFGGLLDQRSQNAKIGKIQVPSSKIQTLAIESLTSSGNLSPLIIQAVSEDADSHHKEKFSTLSGWQDPYLAKEFLQWAFRTCRSVSFSRISQRALHAAKSIIISHLRVRKILQLLQFHNGCSFPAIAVLFSDITIIQMALLSWFPLAEIFKRLSL